MTSGKESRDLSFASCGYARSGPGIADCGLRNADLKPQLMDIRYGFTPPDETPAAVLDQIGDLITRCGGVGTSWIKENLKKAFLIGYAIHEDRVVGTSTHKYPKERYRKKIEAETGLDLSGYLERGYTAVDPAFRNRGIGLKIIQGLIEKSKRRKIYVTIHMNNPWPLKMTQRVGMVLAARFMNHRTGHELGVFTNETPYRNVLKSSKYT